MDLLAVVLCLSILLEPARSDAVPAWRWLSNHHWVLPATGRPAQPTDRVRFCRDFVCRREIGSPVAVLEVLRPFARNRTFCDIGCRSGEVLLAVQPSARKLFGMDIDPKAVQASRGKGLPVILADVFKVPPPADCEAIYFWVGWQLTERFVDRVRALWRAGHFQRDVLLILPAEALEAHELGVLLHIQHSHGGTLVKVPFDEGDGFRHFGLVAILFLPLFSSNRPLPPSVGPPALTEAAFLDRRAHLEAMGWLFCPQEALPPTASGLPSTALSAIRSLAADRAFCDLYARDGAVLRYVAGHARTTFGLVEGEADLLAARRGGLRVARVGEPLPEGCEVYFVAHTLRYHEQVLAQLQRGPLRRPNATLVVAIPLGHRGLKLFKLWCSCSHWCSLRKVPHSAGPDGQAAFGVVALLLCSLSPPAASLPLHPPTPPSAGPRQQRHSP